jgi:hypothetical protein
MIDSGLLGKLPISLEASSPKYKYVEVTYAIINYADMYVIAFWTVKKLRALKWKQN